MMGKWGRGVKNSCQQRYLPNFSLTGAFCGKEVKTPLQNAQQQNLVLPQSCMERLKD